MKKRIRLRSRILAGVVLLICSLMVAWLVILLGDTFSVETIKRFTDNPSLFFYNWLPIALLMAMIYGITASPFAAFTLGGGLFLAFGLVNKFKLLLRGDPLIPSDLILGGEVAAVVNKDSFTMTTGAEISILIFLAVAVVLFFVKPPRLRLNYRVILAAVSIALMYMAYTQIYCHTSIYNEAPLQGSPYSQTDKYRSRGFVFSFLANVPFINTFEKPEGYSVKKAQDILGSYEDNELSAYHGLKPSIIAVMDEAFFDINRIPGITFTEGMFPLSNYYDITRDAYTGYMYTSAFGGGTANTEFSFLTGVNSCFFSGTTIYSTLVRKNIDALPRMLERLGYYTEAIHPGEDWFYNRKNVFEYMGFDAGYFKQNSAFSGDPKRKGNVSNKEAMTFMLGKYDEFKAAPENRGTPYFGFMVTIENHGPYATDKLINQTAYFTKPEKMTDEVFVMINNYIDGLYTGDLALRGFVDALEQRSDPIVLVYFGDHLPFWGNDSLGYEQFSYPASQHGSMESYLNAYRVPFFIWSNSAAKEAYQRNGAMLEVGEAPEMSTCYLPVTLFDYVGFSKNSYFSYLTELRKELPVVIGKYNKTADGFTDRLPDTLKEALQGFEIVCNYKLLDEKISD